MPLSGYGILYGTVVMVRPARASQSHWLAVIQPFDGNHPAYRVGIELARAEGDRIGIEGQWCDLAKGSAPARQSAARLLRIAHGPDAPRYFTTLQDSVAAGQEAVGLDYVRSGIVALDAFKPTALSAPAALDPVVAEFVRRVRPGATVAVCGTGCPAPSEAHGAAPAGFTGVGNVHMNQGTRTWIRNGVRHEENGANQDGALFVLSGQGVHALFLKYANQTTRTGTDGVALDAGVRDIDAVLQAQAPMVRAYRKAQDREQAAAAAAGQAAGGFAFEEPAGKTLDDPFIADDDSGVIDNPVAQAYASGRIRAPEYIRGGSSSLVMNLSEVRGRSFVDGLGKGIAFDFVGDTGATAARTYKGELAVTDRMCELARTSLPAFCFHVGDVVYFYGEGDYFPAQFAVPFKNYPAPIFAIPGNHDACVYDDRHTPLKAFIDVFCAESPSNGGVLGGAARTTLTQPGTYFTLDAPHVSIIGLFSGAAESRRYMSAQQLAHFYSELERLAALRAGGDRRAIILAVHHLPQFYTKSPDAMSQGLDDACARAGLWPDAVVAGHAHLYQRFVRTVGGKRIPYVVTGNGGYKISNGQDAQVDGRPQVSGNVVVKALGFVRATCDGKTLSFRAVGTAGADLDAISVPVPAR